MARPINAFAGAVRRVLAREARAEHRARSCVGKRQYGTLGEANVVALRVSLQTGEEYSAYYCTHCRQHHTGHKPDWLLREEGSLVNVGEVYDLVTAEKEEQALRERLNGLTSRRNELNEQIKRADDELRAAASRTREAQRRALHVKDGQET